MHEVADFRSDTVTRPTPAMRRAMAEAEVGDDVLGDDPTVKRLEALVAGLFGKEAGLYVPSGTMGNSVSIGAQVRPGEEMIAEEWAHCVNFEGGAAGAVWGAMVRTLPGGRGALDPDLVAKWIRPGSLHTPRTALVAVENTHNFHGGAVVPLGTLRSLRDLTRERGVRLHLDGARIWNAATASGVTLREYGSLADTLSVCLSKGLCAPVGSVVLGDREFIDRARQLRKRLGGGMRQVGVLAAAGIVAVEEMRGRLAEDHANARLLADGMARLPGLERAGELVETNIFFVRTTRGPARDLVERLSKERILALAMGERLCRFVTHHDVDHGDVERALAAMGRILGGGGS
ncbi:MAG: beta-eliminating lyase-related protein [Planctomycetes bacterium]|jgi:threonine aldolase|nr:beta-eliminating lyase-related protein [Planctomycetota bacterium]